MAAIRSARTNSENNIGLCHSIYKEAPLSIVRRELVKEIRDKNICSDVQRNRGTTSNRCCETVHSNSRIPVSNVLNSQAKRQGSADLRSKTLKRVLKPQKVSVDKPRPCTKISSSVRLPSENRHVTSLLSRPDKGKSPKVPLSIVCGKSVPANMPSVRPIKRSSCFFPADELGRGGTKIKGHTGISLPRRFPTSSSGSLHSRTASSIDDNSPAEPWVDVKSTEVYNKTFKSDRIFGHRLGYHSQPKKTTGKEGGRFVLRSSKGFNRSSLELEVRNVVDRQVGVRCVGNPIGTSLYSKSSEGGPSLKRGNSPPDVSHSIPSSGRLSLVDSTSSRSQPNIRPKSNHFCHNRRIRYRLGCTIGEPSPGRNLDNGTAKLAYKQKRAVHGINCFVQVSSNHQRSVDNATVGQQDRRVIHSESRGNKITGSSRGNSESLSAGRSAKSHNSPLFLTGSLQHDSGSLVEGNGSSRLASEPANSTQYFREVGSSTDRPIRHISLQSRPMLRYNRCERHRGGFCQCIQSGVALFSSMGFPSTASDSESSPAPAECIRRVFDGGAPLGESVLEGITEAQGPGCSVPNPEPRPASSRSDVQSPAGEGDRFLFRGLEDTGWSSLVSGLDYDDINLLQGAWRDSTWKTYGSAWKQWVSWGRLNNVHPSRPSPQDLSTYLGYLARVRKLAYATILVHKSVIVSLADPSHENRLSSHPLITTMLKGISLSKCSLSVTKSTIWNVQDLVNWLRLNVPIPDNIFQVSRHVALLLLLATGRRIHDLTLLRINESHCQISDSSIKFWPAFGSKTDNPKSRQSGWELTSSGDAGLDLVKWVKCLIECSADRRGARKDLFHLFITTRGEVKAATRTIIAGWLKTAFCDLGIDCSPGSIRSAVASSRFENDVPLDRILSNGNWRGSTNFFKHYCKTVDHPRVTSVNILNDSFNVI